MNFYIVEFLVFKLKYCIFLYFNFIIPYCFTCPITWTRKRLMNVTENADHVANTGLMYFPHSNCKRLLVCL